MTCSFGTGQHILSTGNYIWKFVVKKYVDLGISLNRNFVALQGYFQQKMHRINTNKEDLLRSSMLEICVKSPYCEAISKDDQNSFFQYEKILMERFINDTEWTTVLPFNLVLLKNKRRSGFINFQFHPLQIFPPLDIDLCCPETEEIKNLKIGRREVIVQVSFTLTLSSSSELPLTSSSSL